MARDSYEMKNRLTRGGSLFGTDPQVQLRTALRSNDFIAFKKLVSSGGVDLEYIYQHPDYKTCLELAVSEPNKQQFVKLLLQHEVEVNKLNETHAAAPIHFAVENGNIEALKALLEDDRIDVNIKRKGNTPLLMAIKKIEDLDDDRERELAIYEDMVELLLKSNCDVNAPDMKGITPVYSAAKQGLERIITLIIEYSKDPVDLDTYKDRRGKTARCYLKEAFPHMVDKFEAISTDTETIDIDKLFMYLSRHEENNFIRDYAKLVKKNEHRPVLSANNGMNTMLQFSTEKGFEKVVKTLLESGADPNSTCSGNTTRPIGIACQNGFYKILKIFVNHDSTLFDSVNGESLLQITIKGMRSYSSNPKSDFKACLELLLNNAKVNMKVNHPDGKDNTALHYAARNGDNETVLELLRHGACIGLRNKFNEPPLADINPKTFETFLDECIDTNGERPSDDDYEIHMKYSFLVHPNNSLENELYKPLMNNSNNNEKEYDAILAPETDALLYMTRNEELRPLLKHPVITSFLYLKWQRISCLFYANITFYSLLWLCLILYIILGYGVEKKQPTSIEALNVVTHVGAIIGLILLILRELFQLLVSPIRYLQSIENWMEIALIFVTAIIVCDDNARESTKQQLSAVAILLSSAELVLLIGQFPNLSTNIVMLRTVSWNFFKFLLWYCILIIAFALSFYTLFRQVVDPDQIAPNPNNTGKDNENNDEEEDFFEDPGKSLFKTIVMLTGEFDAGSIKFSTFPVTSHIIFMVFVFMIPIVLFNLLNGLAVSDTQEIRANAELVGHISRIKLISYFESVLIGNVRASAKPSKCWMCLPIQIQNLNIIKPKMFCIKPFAKRISLFPYFLPTFRIIVKPNQYNNIEIPRAEPLGKYGDDYEDVENGRCCFDRCQNYRLDRKIVKNAKIIISKRTNQSEFDEIKDKLNHCEMKIDGLEHTLNRVLQVLELKQK